MQPKHPQIFPTPNRPWRILKAHMAGSPKLRQWTSTGSWKLMTVLMSGLSVLVTQVASGEHDHLSIRCQGAIEVIDLFWMFWHLLSWARLAQLQASPTHGKRCRWQGGSWPQSRSTEIYWDLPSLSFFRRDHLWSSKVVTTKLCNPQSTNPTLYIQESRIGSLPSLPHCIRQTETAQANQVHKPLHSGIAGVKPHAQPTMKPKLKKQYIWQVSTNDIRTPACGKIHMWGCTIHRNIYK